MLALDLGEAPRGDRRTSDAHSAGDERLFRIVWNRVRAFTPWPGAFTKLDNRVYFGERVASFLDETIGQPKGERAAN